MSLLIHLCLTPGRLLSSPCCDLQHGSEGEEESVDKATKNIKWGGDEAVTAIEQNMFLFLWQNLSFEKIQLILVPLAIAKQPFISPRNLNKYGFMWRSWGFSLFCSSYTILYLYPAPLKHAPQVQNAALQHPLVFIIDFNEHPRLTPERHTSEQCTLLQSAELTRALKLSEKSFKSKEPFVKSWKGERIFAALCESGVLLFYVCVFYKSRGNKQYCKLKWSEEHILVFLKV